MGDSKFVDLSRRSIKCIGMRNVGLRTSLGTRCMLMAVGRSYKGTLQGVPYVRRLKEKEEKNPTKLKEVIDGRQSKHPSAEAR